MVAPDTKQNSETSAAPKKVRRGCAGIFFCIMVVCAAVWGALLGAFVCLLQSAQTSIAALDDFRPRIGSKVYSSDGELLGEFTNEAQQPISLSEMPLHLQKAFIATEDDRFYEHRGVRVDAIANALLYIARTGTLRGGSTITQQLARSIEVTGVSREQTLSRKRKEMMVALLIEREFTKDEILELYLNQIFLGKSARGVEAAAQQYFGKNCRDMTLDECALLAGIARAPNTFRPDLRPEAAGNLRNLVLKQMLDNGFITEEERGAAVAVSVKDKVLTTATWAERIDTGTGMWQPNRFKAAYFVEQVRRIILNDLVNKTEDVFEGGLRIETTIDMRLQRAAEEVLYKALDEFDAKKREQAKKSGREDEFVPVCGALVCIDNRPGFEGYLRAMVGGRDFEKSKFNLATQAKRQPGSSVKPFVWAAAIHHGRTPSDILVDEPFERLDGAGKLWRPENFGGTFSGPITLRHALEKSVNIISIKLVEELSMPMVRSYMQSAGIRTPIDNAVGLTIGLGTPVVTVLDQCVAYATFANGGVRCEPLYVTTIKDRDGFSQYKGRILKTPDAIPANVAYVVTYLMEGVASVGTGSRSKALGRPRAGKTGTSNESKDAWFCGFTPQYTCVVWLGYEDNRPLGRGQSYTGGALACPIWAEFMIRALEDLPVLDFRVPPGVSFFSVNRETGLKGGDFKEAFITGTEPPTQPPVFEVPDEFQELPFEARLEEPSGF